MPVDYCSPMSLNFRGDLLREKRGGCFPFQAQYLRRIRVPQIESVQQRDQIARLGASEPWRFRAPDDV